MALSKWGRRKIAGFFRSALDWTRKWTSGTQSSCLSSLSLRSLVWRSQPGSPNNFQLIRNRSFNKELGFEPHQKLSYFSIVSILMFSLFRMVSLVHLPVFLVWLLFSKIYRLLICWRASYTYCLVYKSALYLFWGEQSGYKTLFENIAKFSLPRNRILLFLQLEVIILDLGAENSLGKKKRRISFPLTKTLALNKKKINGQPSAGRCFLSRRHEVIPVSLFGRTGIHILINLSHNSEIAVIITLKLLANFKKEFVLASPEKYFSNKRNKIERGARSRDGKACSVRFCVTFHLHSVFL